uniref:Trimethyllysine dioxygenase, mitochondrial n=1 Tax=Acrobeloides nanus TaxID=290746 RepID=A0A914EK71_9BILA
MPPQNGYLACPNKVINIQLKDSSEKKYQCLRLIFEGTNQFLDIPLVWLRDHCRSRRYYDWETNLRKLRMPHIFEKSKLTSFNFDEEKQNLHIQWEDGHESDFKIKDILDWSIAKDSHVVPYTLWDRETLKEIPKLSSKNFNFTEFAQLFIRFGLVMVTDVDSTDEVATKTICEKIANIHSTFWGEFFVVSADEDDQQKKMEMQVAKDDTAYKNVELGLHTDGMYFDQCPGIQVFHCLRQAPIGGESILVDGFSVAEKFKKSYPEYFKILQTTPIEHRYFEGYDIEDKIIDSAPLKLYARCVEPIINCDGDKFVQIRYKPYNRAPFRNLKIGEENTTIETIKFYEALEKFAELMDAPENELKFLLEPGTVLFFDNFRLLHARTEFQGSRKLLACYLSRDTFLSKARPVLGENLCYSI